MKNEKEQSPDSLRFERFAMLSASAVGLSWNTYKSIEAIVTTPIDPVKIVCTQPHLKRSVQERKKEPLQ